jgi:hypothetical protein
MICTGRHTGFSATKSGPDLSKSPFCKAGRGFFFATNRTLDSGEWRK